jgi:hypothetical protein
VAEQLERGPERCITQLAYRPCEERAVCVVAPLCHRPRPRLLQAVGQAELCLLSARKERGLAAWNLFAPARLPADSSFLSTRSSCRTRVFPSHDPDGQPNLDARLQSQLAERVGEQPTVRRVMAYVLGVLGAPRYRREHDALLKRDYPRVPWPADRASFEAAAQAGEAFVEALCDPLLPAAIAVAACGDDHSQPPFAVLEPDGRPGPAASMGQVGRVCVGHHPLVVTSARASFQERAERAARARLWDQAEKRADEAYAQRVASRGTRAVRD